jgi:hypothetical protein
MPTPKKGGKRLRFFNRTEAHRASLTFAFDGYGLLHSTNPPDQEFHIGKLARALITTLSQQSYV